MKCSVHKVSLRWLFLVVFMAEHVVAYDEALRAGSVVYGISTVADKSNVSDNCAGDLNIFATALDNNEEWAAKLFDYSGKAQASFTMGRSYWFGSPDRCNDIMTPLNLRLSTKYGQGHHSPLFTPPPYPVSYKMAYFKFDMNIVEHTNVPTEDHVQLGLCLPASCASNETFELLQTYFDEKIFYVQRIYKTNFTMSAVKQIPGDADITSSTMFIIMAIIAGSSLALAAIGTIYDVYYWGPKTRQHQSNSNNNPEKSKYLESILTKRDTNGQMNNTLLTVHEQTMLEKCLMCFSLNKNSKMLMNTKVGADSIPCIHGIRSLGMLWILLTHTCLYCTDMLDNKPYAFSQQKVFASQLLFNAFLAVDTFFFMSGFLVAYLFYTAMKKRSSRRVSLMEKTGEFFMMIFQRYTRLTPLYAVTIVISGLTWWYIYETSQFLTYERNELTCATYWYRNLLYINNFYPREEMCLSWSWYVSNDMQFFVLTSALVLLSTVWFKLAAAITIGLTIGSCVATGYLSYAYEYWSMKFDEKFLLVEVMYDRPWTRIGPNLIGVMTGYWLAHANGKLPFKKNTIRLLWTISTLITLIILFFNGFPYVDDWMTLDISIAYMALGRTLWACGTAWIVVACSTGHGGFLNRFLTWPQFVPLSRLTYCAYLINPVLIVPSYTSSDIAPHTEYISVFLRAAGVVIAVFVASSCMSLLFESPNILLLKILNSKPKAKPTKVTAVASDDSCTEAASS